MSSLLGKITENPAFFKLCGVIRVDLYIEKQSLKDITPLINSTQKTFHGDITLFLIHLNSCLLISSVEYNFALGSYQTS